MARVVLWHLHKKPSAGSLSDSNNPGPGFWSQPIAGPPGDVPVPTTPHLHSSNFPWFADRHGQSWYLVSEYANQFKSTLAQTVRRVGSQQD